MIDAHMEHWRRELAGLEPLEVPAGRPRLNVDGGEVATREAILPGEVVEGVRKLAAEHGTTPPVVVLAAFHLLLGRYGRQEDVATLVRAEPAGPVPVRTTLTGGFGGLVAQVSDRLRDAQAHPVPLARLGEADGLPWVRAVLGEAEAADGDPPVDLALGVREEAGTLEVRIRHATGHLDRPAAERMAGHLGVLLAAAVAAPEKPLGELDMLTEGERHLLLGEWSAGPATVPAGHLVHRLVEEQAARRPGAVAVICGDERLTYRELDARAGRLAARLVSRGVGPDVPVGLLLDRGTDMIVALLAIMKAGGAYVPLDPEYPDQRLAFVLEDTGAPVVIAHGHLRGRLPAGPEVIAPDEPADAAAQPAGPGAGPGDLAFVIYTSGSTGVPKGVAVPNAALANLLEVMRGTFPAAEGAVLFATSIAFDIATIEVFLPLTSGGRVVVATREQARNPRDLVDLIDAHGVALAQATPSAWRPLVAALEAGGPRDLQILTGGETLPADLAAAMLRAGSRVVTAYGPTETTIYMTSAEIRDVARGVPIGRPFPGTEVYVVDDAGLPVPVGVPGELLIGGVCLARGYVGRPEETIARFVPHPFSADPGARVYRSGDLVRWAPDGDLECLGRLDHQVKVRGYRVEPGEIEAVLSSHEDVASCVVTAREDVPGDAGGKALVAYCVPAPGRAPGVAGLRQWCADRLPGYMVPSAFVFLDAIPLTTSGKTDRRALPAPEGDRSGLDSFVAPRTPAERAVARIWAEALWIDEVGARDDFFELGGDSLIAVRVAARLRDEFALEVPVSALFTHTTVEDLAGALAAARRSGGVIA
ncbi:amino acid adenylation domain-containing protein [Sphaerisporangium album]|uniref:Amino acid adenylation domain-containing protein n=2 Tax=Sphaerisporangium album TaxID=509200 RepID=A0A367F937_9ACTN|nr:amino acid adenylation domain-containing protein [Sphaerisporangium album]